MDIILCHALKCLPKGGGLYDQDAEFVEWYYKFIGHLAEAGNQPVDDSQAGLEQTQMITNALMQNT